jgi:hypothetical protein
VPILKTIFFRDLDGRSLSLTDVPLDMTVQAMADRLGNEKAMDTSWLRFTWSGKQWNPGRHSQDAIVFVEARSVDSCHREEADRVQPERGEYARFVL